MSFDMLGQLNWLAVVVAALVYFVLGAIWYAPPTFGRIWQRSIGWDPDAAPPQMQVTGYLIPLVAYLVMAAATAMLAAATGSTDVQGGLTLGVVIGVAFALGRTAVDAAFDPHKPQKWVWFAVTSGYHLVGIVLVAIIVSVWQ
jgi:hypothetical protein